MNIHYETNFLTQSENSCGTAATIGFFDGVHKGHKFLLKNLCAYAKEKNYTSVVITFANHPREIFQKDSIVPLLSSTDEKKYLIENTGVDKCIILKFDEELSKLTSREFIKILAEKYNLKLLLVGYDHKFGSDVESTIDDYVKCGEEFGVKVVLEELYLQNSVDISSSKVRYALMSGDVELANAFLGYKFQIEGVVVNGKKIGRTLGYPTANLLPDVKKLVPRKGVYAVRVEIEDGEFCGMLNIGTRPTVDGASTSIEVHIIGYSGDLYGRQMRIVFERYIREEHCYPTKEALMEQIARDKVEVEGYFLGTIGDI